MDMAMAQLTSGSNIRDAILAIGMGIVLMLFYALITGAFFGEQTKSEKRMTIWFDAVLGLISIIGAILLFIRPVYTPLSNIEGLNSRMNGISITDTETIHQRHTRTAVIKIKNDKIQKDHNGKVFLAVQSGIEKTLKDHNTELKDAEISYEASVSDDKLKALRATVTVKDGKSYVIAYDDTKPVNTTVDLDGNVK